MRCPAAPVGGGSGVELADIVRAEGERYQRLHRLAACQRRALTAIVRCRTAALGGYRRQCDICGTIRLVYHSCRNRHCPKCQGLAQERWLAARRDEVLPVPYVHLVFTLPHELNVLAQAQPRRIYALLFRAASDVLLAFAQRHLEGVPAITAVLHTWGRNLAQHIHLHCLVSGGALSAEGTRWTAAPARFLFPVRALARVFRGKFVAGLRAGATGRAPASKSDVWGPAERASLAHTLERKPWVVYCKPPLAGPEQVLNYLARYTHRIALSNDRLVGFDDRQVRFRWKDHRDGRTKILVLPAEEFLRRFLIHVLPDRFVRIRHYGLLANRTRRSKLARARQSLGVDAPVARPPESAAEMMLRITGEAIDRCPVCRQGRLETVETLAPQRLRVAPAPWNSS